MRPAKYAPYGDVINGAEDCSLLNDLCCCIAGEQDAKTAVESIKIDAMVSLFMKFVPKYYNDIMI